MKAVCVFLGSNNGAADKYKKAAENMGRELAARGITCVFGGSNSGLMKVLADSAMAAGGEVIGVTVTALKDKEIYHPGLSELHVVDTMHQRKEMMAELSDGFVTLPGGVGTLDELFEVYTWNLLGFHSKPCGILDVDDFYGSLFDHLARVEKEGFLKAPNHKMLLKSQDPAALLDMMAAWKPAEVDWGKVK